ncbi:hypothetical protein TNCT_4941 [Trichonephila clavata]|uniref:BTB domain-containing protein n=1 Tax=Trichonephila clavata TaxID=2740835 RepID=A0A8X6KL54_TRICU|nr:hypothetical protein TNCT_4941 [Trichonephila clavata]
MEIEKYEPATIDERHFLELYNLHKEGYLCDVTIHTQSETESFQCHRLVLAASSKYFKCLFSPHFKECFKDSLAYKDVKDTVMKLVIEFAYTGKIELDCSNFQDVLNFSCFLLFDSLTDKCCTFVIDNIDSL